MPNQDYMVDDRKLYSFTPLISGFLADLGKLGLIYSKSLLEDFLIHISLSGA